MKKGQKIIQYHSYSVNRQWDWWLWIVSISIKFYSFLLIRQNAIQWIEDKLVNTPPYALFAECCWNDSLKKHCCAPFNCRIVLLFNRIKYSILCWPILLHQPKLFIYFFVFLSSFSLFFPLLLSVNWKKTKNSKKNKWHVRPSLHIHSMFVFVPICVVCLLVAAHGTHTHTHTQKCRAHAHQ